MRRPRGFRRLLVRSAITTASDPGPSRILLTGVTGFLGRHVAASLGAAGHQVVGFSRTACHDPVEGTAAAVCGSILDIDALARAVAEARPQVVVHAAGLVGSAVAADEAFDANVLGTDRLLRALGGGHATKPTKLVLVSSSAVYGSPQRLPIDELTPPAPLTPYGASKLAQEMVALQYQLDRGLDVLRVRLFNLVGPGGRTSTVLHRLASDVAAAETGRPGPGPGPIPVGNVWPRRDFIDVRDAARAISLLVGGPLRSDVVNVATGRSWSVAECCDLLAAEARCPVEFASTPSRQRSVEIDDQIGSWARLHEMTGWKPEIPFPQTVRDVLDDWRSRAGTAT